jgi:hypothetical protein
MHWPLHIVSLGLHAQRPLMQLAPLAHATPHWPQSKGSDVTSTHAPAQLVSPVAHVVVHAPREQTSPATHVVPHAPQLLGSPCVSVQTPWQRRPPL